MSLVPYPAVEALRRRGHDVVTLAELGQAHQAVPDTVVLDLAIAACTAGTRTAPAFIICSRQGF